MSFTEIFLRILIVMWFPVWTMQQRAQELLTGRHPPSQLNYNSHIQMGVSKKCSNKPPFPHRNHNTCLAFYWRLPLWKQRTWVWSRQRTFTLSLLFLVCFPRVRENKDGSEKRTASSGSGNDVPSPLSNPAVTSGVRYPCMSNLGVRIKEKGPNVEVTSKRASAGNPDPFSGGSSPTPEPQATWIIELSPGMVHPGHPHRWHTHSLL